jgi:hypothetical protein
MHTLLAWIAIQSDHFLKLKTNSKLSSPLLIFFLMTGTESWTTVNHYLSHEREVN